MVACDRHTKTGKAARERMRVALETKDCQTSRPRTIATGACKRLTDIAPGSSALIAHFETGLINENPLAEKIERSDESNRANSAYSVQINSQFARISSITFLLWLIIYMPCGPRPFGTLARRASSSQGVRLVDITIGAAGQFPRRETHSNSCALGGLSLDQIQFFAWHYRFNC